MQTPNEQISQFIDEQVQDLIQFVTDPSVVQIEITMIGLLIMLLIIGNMVLNTINHINEGSNEYNASVFDDFDYEDKIR